MNILVWNSSNSYNMNSICVIITILWIPHQTNPYQPKSYVSCSTITSFISCTIARRWVSITLMGKWCLRETLGKRLFSLNSFIFSKRIVILWWWLFSQMLYIWLIIQSMKPTIFFIFFFLCAYFFTLLFLTIHKLKWYQLFWKKLLIKMKKKIKVKSN